MDSSLLSGAGERSSQDRLLSVQPSYEILAHTADTGLIVRGADWADLLGNAVEGFYSVLLADPSCIRPGEIERLVEVEAEDRAELLVRWLAELVYLFDAERALFADVAFEELSDRRLRARLRGELFDPDRHPAETEIKAVTYHGAEVVETDDGLRGRVIFDL